MAKRRTDPKVAALRADRSLNPRPGDVVDEAYGSSEFFDARDLVQVKYEMVRRVRVDGEPVSRSAACVRVVPPVVLSGRGGGGRARPGRAGAGPARAAAGAQTHRGDRLLRPSGA